MLSSAGYNCTFRGEIKVKGKGMLPTYWIDMTAEGNEVQTNGGPDVDRRAVKNHRVNFRST